MIEIISKYVPTNSPVLYDFEHNVEHGENFDKKRKLGLIIVLFKSFRNYKRHNKGNFTLKSNSNYIKL